MAFIYLASPYSHPDPEVREARFKAVMDVAAHLAQHCCVYSPIAHWHPIASHRTLPTDFAFWKAQNFGMLVEAKELHVLCLDGWEQSVGVAAEIELARALGLPVLHRYPNNALHA